MSPRPRGLSILDNSLMMNANIIDGWVWDSSQSKATVQTKTQRKKEYALEKIRSPVGLELKIYLEEKWEQGLKT